jgi:hypothetical protein
MKRRCQKPPRRLGEHEGESKPTETTLSLSSGNGKPFDAVERKLSHLLDMLLDIIDTYREANR